MLQVENILFKYHKNFTLKAISFNANAGDHIAITGESGSGKSTLLKLIYGEYDLLEGAISWKEQAILGPSHNLVIGYPFMKYVSQEFDLMPFTTVSENIGAYLSNFYLDKKEERIQELLEVVELTDFANVKVKYLSGGQKQRVALARAIALEPEIILLDEPFSHIDNFKKQSLRRNLFKYLKQEGITCIVATHDKHDVLAFSDMMIVLKNGELLCKEHPKTLYEQPQQPLIASFFGNYSVIEPYGIVYAHQLNIVSDSKLKATVTHCYFEGSHYLIEATLHNRIVYVEAKAAMPVGSTICLELEA